MLLRSTSRTAQRLFAAVRANCSSSSSGCTLLRAHLSSTRVLAAADGEFTDVLHFETIQPRNETLTPEFFIDKAVLVVNTASQCGYTPQLTQLQQLHEQFEARGLVVLAVPSNDFSNQEPGTDAEILAKYTAAPFHVRFPIAKKTPVTGDDAHAFFERIVVEYSRSVAPTYGCACVCICLLCVVTVVCTHTGVHYVCLP